LSASALELRLADQSLGAQCLESAQTLLDRQPSALLKVAFGIALAGVFQGLALPLRQYGLSVWVARIDNDWALTGLLKPRNHRFFFGYRVGLNGTHDGRRHHTDHHAGSNSGAASGEIPTLEALGNPTRLPTVFGVIEWVAWVERCERISWTHGAASIERCQKASPQHHPNKSLV
jgi:hypothetical protein